MLVLVNCTAHLLPRQIVLTGQSRDALVHNLGHVGCHHDVPPLALHVELLEAQAHQYMEERLHSHAEQHLGRKAHSKQSTECLELLRQLNRMIFTERPQVVGCTRDSIPSRGQEPENLVSSHVGKQGKSLPLRAKLATLACHRRKHSQHGRIDN